MAYKQNGINILGTGLGGKETDTNRGKGLGGDELQRKFGEKIEVPKVPKVTPTKRNNQTSIDGTANYQADLKNSMDAMPVRGLKGETANTSKPDGFEKARNRGGSLPAGNSFTDLGIATAKNILSGAKEGINKFKEKRAAKIAADPKRAKIKDLKSQLKEKRKSGRAENKSGRQDKRIAKLEGKLGVAATPATPAKPAASKKPSGNGRSIMTDAVKTSAKNIKNQAAPTRFTKVPVKPSTRVTGGSKSSGGSKGSVSTTQSNQPTPSIKTQAMQDANSAGAGRSSTAVGSVGGPQQNPDSSHIFGKINLPTTSVKEAKRRVDNDALASILGQKKGALNMRRR